MNRSESKYFNTAKKMDEAFLTLLDKKDFAYITVKDICETAGVNRSTFYLHYETVDDLLKESADYIIKQFLRYMDMGSEKFIDKIEHCPLEKLYLITPEYLTPYLNYVKEHKKIFSLTMKNAAILGMENAYGSMFKYIFVPILKRYGVKEKDMMYIMSFYIKGIIGIISEWLDNDCNEDVDYIVEIIQSCVIRYRS